MSKQKAFNVIFIYKILLCVSIIVSGICLICGSLYIFFSGNGYSREIVATTFSKISIPIYISIAFILGSFFIKIKTKSKFYKPKNFDQKKEPVITHKSALIIKILIIFVAIVLLISGAIYGGFKDVLTKAVNICTECIGLG